MVQILAWMPLFLFLAVSMVTSQVVFSSLGVRVIVLAMTEEIVVWTLNVYHHLDATVSRLVLPRIPISIIIMEAHDHVEYV